MAVKTPTIWNNMYIGNMSEQQAELIMQTRQSNIIPNLKKMIFNFPTELIKESIDRDISIRQLLKDVNIDSSQYVSELRDYQTVGTAFMYLSPRSVIADGCGLGKTVEISGLFNWLRYKGEMNRFLMAVETSAIGQVQAELSRFCGFYTVAMPSEAPKIKKVIENTDWTKVDGIIIKHSTLRSDAFSKWLALNLDENGMCKLFNTFILDESSVIKNDTTKMFQYTQNICNIVGRVHLMNATAFETSIVDIYNQLNMINGVLLPKRWRIEKEFCTYTRSSYWTKENGKAKLNFRRERSGYKNQEAFKQSLRLVYFGRSAKDVGKDLPHIYKVYEVEPSNAMSLGLEKGFRYNELLNCPSLVPDAGIPMDRKNVPKLDRLCDLIQNEFAGQSVMVYCFHLAAQQAIADEMVKIGRKPITLNGSCTDAERLKAQDGFNNGTYDVIITNIKKSLNLYGGDVCIFYSMETNPSKSFQIASRVDRHIDDSIKTFVLMLYKGTDEYRFFTTTVKQRAKDARDLTIDAKTTVDFFYDAMMEEEAGNLGL